MKSQIILFVLLSAVVCGVGGTTIYTVSQAMSEGQRVLDNQFSLSTHVR